jgi:hypothetical protein
MGLDGTAESRALKKKEKEKEKEKGKRKKRKRSADPPFAKKGAKDGHPPRTLHRNYGFRRGMDFDGGALGTDCKKE